MMNDFAFHKSFHSLPLDLFNPNSEGVPVPYLSEGGGADSAPPGKCSINGPNELKFCV